LADEKGWKFFRLTEGTLALETVGRAKAREFAAPGSLRFDLGSYTSGRLTDVEALRGKCGWLRVAKLRVATPAGKPKMKRLQETIGESYYEYLSKLTDLVLLMDEAHRYPASAGANAIDGLKPILGLELTATPKTVGSSSRPFKNVIYSYGLGQ